MIINKELVVSNRKKADIVDELRQKKFRPFPKAAKAKAAGETEDVEENDDAEEAASGTSTDYDYLLGMAIWSLTKEKVRVPHWCMTLAHTGCSHLRLEPQIEKLRQQAADKEKELLALLELTPTQIWNTDLDRFLEEWEVSGQRPSRCLCACMSLEGLLTPGLSHDGVTESVSRVGRKGRGRLERQEGQAETSDAQDSQIHRLGQTRRRWPRRRLGRRRRLYADQEGRRRQSAQAHRPRRRRIAREAQSHHHQGIGRRNEPR